MKTPPIVSPQEWEAARQQLLVKEKDLTRARDALAAERRRMPWLAVEKKYEFDGPQGKASLLDLFEGRRQLIVYRAFFEPGVYGWPDHACPGCSLVADQVAHVAHLNARDTTLAFASRAPQPDIERVKARMGWKMPWYTMTDGFDTDFGVDEWHGTNAFIRDGDSVFRTYFINNRGDEADGEHLELPRPDRARAPGGLGGLAGRLPPNPTVQVVEVARRILTEEPMELPQDVRQTSAATTGARTGTAAVALTATLGLAAGSWVVAVWQMSGMDMGVATRLGSFGFFVGLWVVMMAAMMLPGAAPAVLRRAHASGGARTMPLFVGSYLAVWALVGVAVYALYRPHGSVAAGAVVIAAGVYEVTPLKRHFRRRCRDSVRSGFGFGLCCVGSSIGLMLMLVALGVMSIPWMCVIAVLVLAQKLLPAQAAIDVPLALAIIGLGVLIVLAPSSVPGLTPPM